MDLAQKMPEVPVVTETPKLPEAGLSMVMKAVSFKVSTKKISGFNLELTTCRE